MRKIALACPHCGVVNDKHTDLDTGVTDVPPAGAMEVCECGGIAVVTQEPVSGRLYSRQATAEEAAALRADPRYERALDARELIVMLRGMAGG
jgi:hypothetical protein